MQGCKYVDVLTNLALFWRIIRASPIRPTLFVEQPQQRRKTRLLFKSRSRIRLRSRVPVRVFDRSRFKRRRSDVASAHCNCGQRGIRPIEAFDDADNARRRANAAPRVKRGDVEIISRAVCHASCRPAAISASCRSRHSFWGLLFVGLLFGRLPFGEIRAISDRSRSTESEIQTICRNHFRKT